MILLTFDIEEFDVPLEYGKRISFEEQIEVSRKGTEIILDILEKYNIRATFFCTVVFAQNALDIMKRIIEGGHEVASHGYAHAKFKKSDLSDSKLKLEEITNRAISGFRIAKMQAIAVSDVYEAGYVYNSSINPTFVPSRYNYFRKPRTYFKENYIFQIPTSVTPLFRIPLFWLSFHNLPFKIYVWLSSITMKKDKYLNLYFHPWEFIELSDAKYGLPKYISRNSGDKMIIRFERYLKILKNKKHYFATLSEFIEQKI